MTRGLPETVLSAAALDALMPMHMVVSRDGTILRTGPTIARLDFGRGLEGSRFFDLFLVRRPHGLTDIARLRRAPGARLQIDVPSGPQTSLKGHFVFDDAGHLVFDLSFGILVTEAVAAHGLTASDFSPTTLAVEMLYLVEAKSAAMAESRNLIVRLNEARAAAERQARTDALTGLHNRRGLEDLIGELIERRQHFGLMHVDLDFFKAINDSFGHAAGDYVLGRVADILKAETRSCDMVVRLGGDEFVLVLRDMIGDTELGAVAARIIETLESPISYEGVDCKISASIGVTTSMVYERPDLDSMLRDADVALYRSKLAGRSRATIHRPDDEPASGGA